MKGEVERRKWRDDHPGPSWECWYCGDPINAVGRRSWSLHVHHINGYDDPINLAPVHYFCHTKLHEHWTDGHPVSVETRAKISKWHKGSKKPWSRVRMTKLMQDPAYRAMVIKARWPEGGKKK